MIASYWRSGLILKRKNKKVIYDSHEDLPRTILTKYWIPRHHRQFLSNLLEKLENSMAKHLNLIVAATPHICDRFTKLGYRTVNINNYPMNEELINQPVNWPTKKPCICYCGYINDKRGIFEILAALEKTNVKLLLAGQFESKSQRDCAVITKGWENVEELGQIRSKWNKVSSVRIYGRISDSASNAELYLLTSHKNV